MQGQTNQYIKTMKSITREDMMAKIASKYPKLSLRTTEEFDGGQKGIWIAGTESGITAKDGFKLFDSWVEDYKETRYVLGVHKEFGNLVEANGWYCEWYDAGTMMVFPD